MFELLVAGAVAVAGLAVLGLVWAVVALVCWLFVLPFKILGLAFRGVAFLLALPFLLIVGVLAAAVFGVGAIVFALPALPIVALAAFVWWLATRHRTARPA
jgi:hypothetical protein